MITFQNSEAQNLIDNGSFEEHYSCPDNTSEVDSVIGWYNVMNTPDFFDSCATFPPVSVPNNVCGSQTPFEGSGYIGLYTWVWWTFYREIVGTQLTASMIPGNMYHISMRVSRGNWTNQAQNQAATNKLGMRFTTHPYSLSNSPVINNFAQVFEDTIITDTLNWALLEWNYLADSAYSYAYIGNFFDDMHTDTINIGWINGNGYYYIDSVNIFCTGCATGAFALTCGGSDFLFDATSGRFILKLVNDVEGNLSIYSMNGQLLKEYELKNQVWASASFLNPGLYIAIVKTEHVELTKKIVIN